MIKLPEWMPALTPRRIFTALLIVAAFVAFAFLARSLDIEKWHARAAATPGWIVFLVLTVLPIAAFPVSPLHAIAGVRFGLWGGVAVVAASIVIQLCVCHGLVQLAPKFFEKHFGRFRKKLPRGAHSPLTAFIQLIPGLPYVASLYLPPMIGVPFRIFFAWSLPLHVVRSAVGVIFGDMSDDLTPARIAGFVVYTLAITVTCWIALQRLRQHLKMPDHAAPATSTA